MQLRAPFPVRRGLLLATALVGLVPAPLVWPEEAPTAAPTALPSGPQAAFAGELEVNLVNVFVTVVDGDGRPVSGLGREHFAIFEAGEPMAIPTSPRSAAAAAPPGWRRRRL